MTNHLCRQLRENCWQDKKIFLQTWKREQIFRQTRYPLSREHPLCSSKKPTGDGLQQTVCESHTNYTNTVFANKMFAGVQVDLLSLLPFLTVLEKTSFPTLGTFCWIVSYLLKFRKKTLVIFEKILCKFWECSRFLKKFG